MNHANLVMHNLTDLKTMVQNLGFVCKFDFKKKKKKVKGIILSQQCPHIDLLFLVNSFSSIWKRITYQKKYLIEDWEGMPFFFTFCY